VRAWEILKRGGFGARERDIQRPLKPISLVPFLFGTRKEHSPPKDKKIPLQTEWDLFFQEAVRYRAQSGYAI